MFRIIMLVIMGSILWKTVKAIRSRAQTTPAMIVWLILWCSIVIVILVPEITTYLAMAVGIGRGVDVVVYSAIIALFYAVFRLTLRIEQIDRHLTDLIRQNALHQWRAQHHDNPLSQKARHGGADHNV